MAITRTQRPELFRRVVLHPPPAPASVVTGSESLAVVATSPDAPAPSGRRPTLSYVERARTQPRAAD